MLRLSQRKWHGLILDRAISILDDDTRTHAKQGLIIVVNHARYLVAQRMYVLIIEPCVRFHSLLAAKEIGVSDLEVSAESARRNQYLTASGSGISLGYSLAINFRSRVDFVIRPITNETHIRRA
jgi:hypothetical protein